MCPASSHSGECLGKPGLENRLSAGRPRPGELPCIIGEKHASCVARRRAGSASGRLRRPSAPILRSIGPIRAIATIRSSYACAGRSWVSSGSRPERAHPIGAAALHERRRIGSDVPQPHTTLETPFFRRSEGRRSLTCCARSAPLRPWSGPTTVGPGTAIRCAPGRQSCRHGCREGSRSGCDVSSSPLRLYTRMFSLNLSNF